LFVYEADPDKDAELVYPWFLNGQEVAQGQQWGLHMSATPLSAPEQQVRVEVADKGGLRDQRTWNIVPHISPMRSPTLGGTEARI